MPQIINSVYCKRCSIPSELHIKGKKNMVNNNEDAVRQLQQVKVFLQNTACSANVPPTVITAYLSLIDNVQLFLCPQTDLNVL